MLGPYEHVVHWDDTRQKQSVCMVDITQNIHDFIKTRCLLDPANIN